jgi:hypothetical protein
MELEQVLIDPNTSAVHKRVQILKELSRMYACAQEKGDNSSALKVIELMIKQLDFMRSKRISLKEMSDEDLEWLLRSEHT